jgi:hypothetical protein
MACLKIWVQPTKSGGFVIMFFEDGVFGYYNTRDEKFVKETKEAREFLIKKNADDFLNQNRRILEKKWAEKDPLDINTQ